MQVLTVVKINGLIETTIRKVDFRDISSLPILLETLNFIILG